MATTLYNDVNANKFPEPVEPLGVTRENLSKSLNTKDKHVFFGFALFSVHNIIRRTLRSIITHARTQPQPPSPDFLYYASYVLEFLHDHHSHEDDIFFPTLQPWIDFSESAHEHEEISLCIERVNATLKDAGEPLAKNVEALYDLLDKHLQKEEWLSNQYARRIPVEVLEALDERLMEAIQEENKKHGSIWALSFLGRCLTPEEGEIIPPAPWIVKYVMQFIGGWIYRKQLAYAPF